MWAAFLGRVGIVERLLDKGANINLKDTFGFTALMLAAEKGDLTIVKRLLDKKADVNLNNDADVNDSGFVNALGLAIVQDKPILVELLLIAGATIDDYAWKLADNHRGNYAKAKRVLIEHKEYKDICGLSSRELVAWKGVQGLFTFWFSTNYFPECSCIIIASYLLDLQEQELNGLFRMMKPVETIKKNLMNELHKLPSKKGFFASFKNNRRINDFQKTPAGPLLIKRLSEEVDSSKKNSENIYNDPYINTLNKHLTLFRRHAASINRIIEAPTNVNKKVAK